MAPKLFGVHKLSGMQAYWTDSDGFTSWYRVHILDKNYSVKVVESPFEEHGDVQEVKLEWGGKRTPARKVAAGPEFDMVRAAFFAAKKKASGG